MRKFIPYVALIPFLTAESACETIPGATAQPNAEISDVLSQVKQALADVQTDLANNALPPLKEVKLGLKTVVSAKGGASAKLLVITIGGTWQQDRVQQVEIVLVPPKAGNPKTISTESITEALERAIVTAAEGVKNAGQGPIPLEFDSLTVVLEFTVKLEGAAGAKPVIGPVTVDASGTISKAATHTLTITFQTPKATKP